MIKTINNLDDIHDMCWDEFDPRWNMKPFCWLIDDSTPAERASKLLKWITSYTTYQNMRISSNMN